MQSKSLSLNIELKSVDTRHRLRRSFVSKDLAIRHNVSNGSPKSNIIAESIKWMVEERGFKGIEVENLWNDMGRKSLFEILRRTMIYIASMLSPSHPAPRNSSFCTRIKGWVQSRALTLRVDLSNPLISQLSGNQCTLCFEFWSVNPPSCGFVEIKGSWEPWGHSWDRKSVSRSIQWSSWAPKVPRSACCPPGMRKFYVTISNS